MGMEMSPGPTGTHLSQVRATSRSFADPAYAKRGGRRSQNRSVPSAALGAGVPSGTCRSGTPLGEVHHVARRACTPFDADPSRDADRRPRDHSEPHALCAA